MVSLAIGLGCGAWVWFDGVRWIDRFVDRPSDRLTGWISLAAVALGALLTHWVWKRVASGPAESTSPSGPSRLVSALLSLLPSAFFLWAVGIAIRLFGSVSALAWTDQSAAAPPSWLARAQSMLTSGTLGRIFDATDPFVDRASLRLCEVLVAYRVHEFADRLERRPGYWPLVSHSRFQRLINDREVKRAIAYGDHARLLSLPEVKATARDPEIIEAMAKLPEPEVRRAEAVP
jgi:hypothetical protein